MGFLDILLGRTRPVKSNIEKLFAVSTAQITLAVKFGANPTGKAGICFKPVESSYFGVAEEELKKLLEIAGRESGSEVNLVKDKFGFQWVLMRDEQFEDLIATLHMISQTLQEQGFGEQLLAAVFEFVDSRQQLIYWIYNYKRGKFYPFVPLGDRRRDNAYELRLRAVMEKEMPIEPQVERWYPIWDIPLSQVRDQYR